MRSTLHDEPRAASAPGLSCRAGAPLTDDGSVGALPTSVSAMGRRPAPGSEATTPSPVVPAAVAPSPATFPPELVAIDQATRAALAVTAQASEWDAPRRAAVLSWVGRHRDALAVLEGRVLTAEREAGTWSLRGDRDLAGFVGRTSHQGRGAGLTAVGQAGTLAAMPVVAEALVDGPVTTMHVTQLTRATAASPTLAAELSTSQGQAHVVEMAARLDGAEFGKALSQLAASLDPAARQRAHDEQRAARSFAWTHTPSGTLLKGRLDTVAGHMLAKAVDALCPRPTLDDERSREQRQADALVAIAARVVTDRATTPGAVAPVQAIVTFTPEIWTALRAAAPGDERGDREARSNRGRDDNPGNPGRQAEPAKQSGQRDQGDHGHPLDHQDHHDHQGHHGAPLDHEDHQDHREATAGSALSTGGGPTDGDPRPDESSADSTGACAEERSPNAPGSARDVMGRLRGAGPVVDETGQAWPASEIARALCDCLLTRAVVGGRDAELNLGRGERRFGRQHWLALHAAGARSCSIGGCGMPLAYTELHHLRWWTRDGGPTDLANCAAYCSFHHHEIHRLGIVVTRLADGTLEHRHPDGRPYGARATATGPYGAHHDDPAATGDPPGPPDDAHEPRSTCTIGRSEPTTGTSERPTGTGGAPWAPSVPGDGDRLDARPPVPSPRRGEGPPDDLLELLTG